jgi:predicted MFS family arabinose efflux permease
MWLLITVFYAYQYILRVLPNTLMPELMSRFHVTVDDLSEFSGLYYIGYAAAHIPIGLLLDRKGLKYVVPVCILLTTLGLVPLMFSNTWAYPVMGRILIGLGSAAAALGTFKVARVGFPANQFARMLGLTVSIGLVAALYSGQMVDYFVHQFGSQYVITAIGGIGVFLASCIFLFMPRQEAAPLKLSAVLQDLKTVFGNTTVLSISLFAGLMVGPLEGFADIWASEFLHTVYHFDDSVSKNIPSYIYFGMCLGTPFLTYFADKTRIYFRTIIVAGFVMCAGFIYILSGLGNAISLYIIFSIIGVMCGYQILVISKASTYVSANLVGLATACTNMIIMAFGYLFHTAIGFLIKSQWDHAMANGVPVYSFDALISSLSVIPEALLVGGYGFILIWRSLKKAV